MERYVFWLYDHTTPIHEHILRPSGEAAICEIDQRQLVARELHPSTISVSDILVVNSFLTGGSRDSEYTVQIRLRQGRGLGLYPMNPLEPCNKLKARSEAEAMIEVIEALRQGIEPRLDTNPYIRELARRGQEDEITRRTWDPFTSPWVFYRFDHPRPTVSRTLLGTFCTVIALAASLALIIWLMSMR